MRAVNDSYAWPLPVTWQRWRSHHSIRHSQNVMLYANFMALEPESLLIEVLYWGNFRFDPMTLYWWRCHDIGYPLLAAEHSPWSGTPCRTTSAHSRTVSPLNSARKPGFSLATSVLSAVETSWQLRYINSHLPYHWLSWFFLQSLDFVQCLVTSLITKLDILFFLYVIMPLTVKRCEMFQAICTTKKHSDRSP